MFFELHRQLQVYGVAFSRGIVCCITDVVEAGVQLGRSPAHHLWFGIRNL